MKLICEFTGVEVEMPEEIAERFLGHGFKKTEEPKPAPKRTPRKTKE